MQLENTTMGRSFLDLISSETSFQRLSESHNRSFGGSRRRLSILRERERETVPDRLGVRGQKHALQQASMERHE